MVSRMRRGIAGAGSAALSCFLAGCAGTALGGGAELQAVRATQGEMRRELADLKQAEAREAEKRGDADAEILLALDDLEARLERIENQLRDLMDGLGRTLARTSAPEPAPVGDAPPVTSQDPRGLYEAAYLQVTRGQYDLAVNAMEDFVRQFPSSDLADNAVYWIGESYYAMRRFNQAVEAFVRLIDAYPRGDKVPAAMLKLGYAFSEMGDAATARRYWTSLVEKYPDREEAALARTRLSAPDR